MKMAQSGLSENCVIGVLGMIAQRGITVIKSKSQEVQ